MRHILLVTMLIIVAGLPSAYADNPVIVKVDVTGGRAGGYNFAVTVKHADAGWKHYVNKWDVVTMDGKLLGSRKLWHPHVNEQPFTRSLAGVKIPDSVKKIKIRVHDSVHGYGKTDYEIDLGK